MIEQNILQLPKKLVLDDQLELEFYFTIKSLCLMSELFGYKSIEDIINNLISDNTFVAMNTALQILYTSIDEEENFTYNEVIRLFNTEERLVKTYQFICEHFTYFINSQKKKTLIKEKIPERVMEIKMNVNSILSLINIMCLQGHN